MIFLDEYFWRDEVTPEQMDRLWAMGWRHFGTYFFRYSISPDRDEIRTVIPLRIELSSFKPSRSQKRVWQKNQDVQVVIRDAFIDQVKEELFLRHRARFKDNVPDSLYNFLSDAPATVPCRAKEVCVFHGDKLIAVSFLDLGGDSASSVYAMFEPAEAKRSLGIFCILASIQYATEHSCRYYYPGYAYREPSVYDYKKNFAALQYLDWALGWRPYQAERVGSEDLHDA